MASRAVVSVAAAVDASKSGATVLPCAGLPPQLYVRVRVVLPLVVSSGGGGGGGGGGDRPRSMRLASIAGTTGGGGGAKFGEMTGGGALRAARSGRAKGARGVGETTVHVPPPLLTPVAAARRRARVAAVTAAGGHARRHPPVCGGHRRRRAPLSGAHPSAATRRLGRCAYDGVRAAAAGDALWRDAAAGCAPHVLQFPSLFRQGALKV